MFPYTWEQWVLIFGRNQKLLNEVICITQPPQGLIERTYKEKLCKNDADRQLKPHELWDVAFTNAIIFLLGSKGSDTYANLNQSKLC